MSTLHNPLATFAAIDAVDLASVPVMASNRHIPRKDQAALARKLLRKLGIVGVSITTPNYSMAQSVDIRLPREEHPGWTGFEQWQHYSYSDMPDDVPAKAAHVRNYAAQKKLAAILAIAFPQHDDRSDSQTDYYDSCWSIN